MKKAIICILLSVFIFLITFKAWAVYFAEDYIYLFENGKRIRDSSVIVTHDIYKKVCVNGVYGLGQQFQRNLIFYGTNESNLKNYDENWIATIHLRNKDCSGYVTQKNEWERAAKQFDEENKDYYKEIQKRVGIAKTREERGKIWDEWNAKKNDFMHKKGFTFFNNPKCNKDYVQEYDIYLGEYINNAVYHTAVTIPEPTDKEVHDAPPFPITGGRIGTFRCFNVDIRTGTVEQIDCPNRQ